MNQTIKAGLLVLLLLTAVAPAMASNFWHDEFYQKRRETWVDSVFKSLTPRQRVGQLFMVAAYSNRDRRHVAELERLITDYNLGGLIFFQGGPGRQARMCNYLQSRARVPMLIAMDAEWGLSMRLDSTVQFPRQMTMGAIKDLNYIYRMGQEMAYQCRRLGVHISFSPAVDVNSNPANPVIGVRSFGEDKEEVARRGVAYMKGLQDNGVIANAKHFPGHGDTESDSHHSLPLINRTKEQIDEVELYPFRALIKNGVQSMMVAHLHIPALDTTGNRASTLSPNIVTNLLRKKLKYEGLIFTDALNMKGVSSYYKSGELELLALQAGNDVLLFPENVPVAVDRITEALSKGTLDSNAIYERVRKVLAAKYNVGLDKYQPIELENLASDLHRPGTVQLIRDLFAEAVTVVKDDHKLLPLRDLKQHRLVSIAIQADSDNTFQALLRNYAPMQTHVLQSTSLSADYDSLLVRLQPNSTVIVSLHGILSKPNINYNIPPRAFGFVTELQQAGHKVVLVIMGNPYSLKYFEQSPTVVMAYEDLLSCRNAVPQILFGAKAATGRLPVTASLGFPAKAGFDVPALKRVRFDLPEAVAVRGDMLRRVDSVANYMVQKGIAPGAQIAVIKDGTVILNKTYGSTDFGFTRAVNSATVYDVASVTKVAATTQAIMHLASEKKLDLDEKLETLLPETRGTNKGGITVRQLLTHQAGLQAFIPFYKKTLAATGWSTRFYKPVKEPGFGLEVAPDLWAIDALPDSIYAWALASDLHKDKLPTGQYVSRYSDLSFLLLRKVAEKKLSQPLHVWLDSNLYQPMGMGYTSFTPRTNFAENQIAPSEQDGVFRQALLQGVVNDEMAAMQGGMAGHAGLFSNALNLALLMQMNMQCGQYAGRRYYDSSTVKLFTQRQLQVNRGLGWAKPAVIVGGDSPASKYASPSSFGHTGFTGSVVWADPEYNLVYVFVTNRTMAGRNPNALARENIRTRIHDIIYEAMMANFPNVGGPVSSQSVAE